ITTVPGSRSFRCSSSRSAGNENGSPMSRYGPGPASSNRYPPNTPPPEVRTNSMWKVSTDPGSDASHTATAGSLSTSRPPPTTVSATQPMTRFTPAQSRTASRTTSAEGAWSLEATTTASETSASPSPARASSAAVTAALAGSGSVEGPAPIRMSEGEISLGGEDEVAFGQAVDLVGADGQPELSRGRIYDV